MAEYLKLTEVARRLDVSEKTARRLVKAGTLPSSFIGGAYRVTEENLEKFLEQAKVEPGKALAPPSPEQASFNDVFKEQEEERRALADLRPWFYVMDRLSERLEALGNPSEFDAGEFRATNCHVADIIAGLNMQLRELRSRGGDPTAIDPISERLRESTERLASAQWASDETAQRALTESELALARRRRAGWEGNPDELVRRIVGQ